MPNQNQRRTTDPLREAIISLEALRGSKVIVYMTGDRPVISSSLVPPFTNTIVAMDVLPLFEDQLKSITRPNKITLAIYTNGGQVETPWPLVNLIRDYCNEFEVIVLKKALSAGTMISLGADKIVMPKGSFLSPVDPARSVQPKNVGNPQIPKQIEIEDIVGYIDFAKEKVGINDQATLGAVLKELSQEIDPSTIGSINRTYSLIRRLAQKLLDLHKDKLSEHQSKELVQQLTEKLFSHTHLISSREAREIGFGDLIEIPDQATSSVIDKIYSEYSKLMKLRQPLNIDQIANERPEVNEETGYTEECITALVHSRNIKYNFSTKLNIKNIQGPQGMQISINLSNQSWTKG